MIRTKKTRRDDFSIPTARKLAERVGFNCSNPDCEAVTVGPGSEKGSSMKVGMAAHITAASPGGPRYNANLSPRERKSGENGIWLCTICGKAVDADESGHTVGQLRQWKRRAEKRAEQNLGLPTANSHFRLLPRDQTMYINVRRLQELAARSHIHLNTDVLKPIEPLLNMQGNLAAYIIEAERALKNLDLEALSFESLNSKADLESSIGQLITFLGKFRSRNAPKLKRDSSVPIVHPTGNLDKDHFAYKNYGRVRLALPLDSLWYASQSSIGFFRGNSSIMIRGLARVHSMNGSVVVASPLWLALPQMM